jgi:hypothetical protein
LSFGISCCFSNSGISDSLGSSGISGSFGSSGISNNFGISGSFSISSCLLLSGKSGVGVTSRLELHNCEFENLGDHVYSI